jgi:hypothetical protein
MRGWVVNGQWSMVNGQWTIVNGQSSMANRQWSLGELVIDNWQLAEAVGAETLDICRAVGSVHFVALDFNPG